MQNLKPLQGTENAEIVFENAIKTMLKVTAGLLGEDFLQGLVKALCNTMKIDGALVARCNAKSPGKFHSVAIYVNAAAQPNLSFKISATPFETLAKQGCYDIRKDGNNFTASNNQLSKWTIHSALARSLVDPAQTKIGILAIWHSQPLENASLINSVLDIFAFRVCAELERQSIYQNLQNEVKINQAQLDSVPALMFMLNRKGEFLRWNQYFRSRFGFSHDKMSKENILSAVHENDRQRIILEIEQIFAKGKGSIYLNGITSLGDLVPMLATAEATFYEGEPVIVGVALDMTEQQEVERNLLRSQGRLAQKNSQLSLINNLIEKLQATHEVKNIAQQVVSLLATIQEKSSIVFSIVDPNKSHLNIIASAGVSSELVQARQTFAMDEPGSPTNLALTSGKLETFNSVIDDERISPILKNLIHKEGINTGLVLPLIYKEEAIGSISIGYQSKLPIRQDEIEFYQTIGSSISLALANARQFAQMKQLAIYDNLTGLPNRNALNQDCQMALKKTKKHRRCLGLILIDLDRFKEINDTLDHQIGDKLLSLIGPRITNVLNDKSLSVYRLGGDEFGVLISHLENEQQIYQIANLIDAAIRQVFVVDGLNLEISSSIGVATTANAQHNANEMLRCAELAMYQIKAEGGGIKAYSSEMDVDTNQRFVIMAEMAEAIRSDQLVLHFQPKYNLKDGKIFSCEALVRWQHREYGLLPPAKFIPFVELTQLIHPLTHWVMKSAMQQIQEWKKQGIQISVAINLSTRNLTDEGFIQQVDDLMHEFEISAEELEFEVTETTLMSNFDKAMQQLNEFHARGIRCSLDDYGTGYSSLSYLKNLPLDILKIDRSFISRMLHNAEDRIIAQSTINLAHRLGMKVVAEGVEDEKTLAELAEQGCDLVQGYFISKPLDAESFAKLYWQNHHKFK